MRIRFKSLSFVGFLIFLVLTVVSIVFVLVVPDMFPLVQIAIPLIFFAFALAIIWPNFDYLRKKPEQHWRQWHDCINDPNQAKRVTDSLNPEIATVKLEEKDMCATYKDPTGKTHKTTLIQCNCRDFHSRKLPCKHMYKLAKELGMNDMPKPAKTGTGR